VPELTFDITPTGPSSVTIAVRGEIDMASASQLIDCIADHAQQHILLDLSGVGFLDSRGVGALIRGYNLLDETGHRLRTTGERDNVLKVLEITAVKDLLHSDGDTPAV